MSWCWATVSGRDTSLNVGAGLLVGLLLCLVFDRIASQWVTESSRDPAILGGVTVLLLVVAGLACLGPARRAASINPTEALMCSRSRRSRRRSP